jgi:hypothetical protein
MEPVLFTNVNIWGRFGDIIGEFGWPSTITLPSTVVFSGCPSEQMGWTFLFIDLFQRDARTLAVLDHPAIPRCRFFISSVVPKHIKCPNIYV